MILSNFESGDAQVFAQVVQHIDGTIVTGDVGSAFVDKFQAILAEEGISRLGSDQHIDFAPPDFNRNIVADDTDTYYVDIQNFEILDQDARIRQLAETISGCNTLWARTTITRSTVFVSIDSWLGYTWQTRYALPHCQD